MYNPHGISLLAFLLWLTIVGVGYALSLHLVADFFAVCAQCHASVIEVTVTDDPPLPTVDYPDTVSGLYRGDCY